MTPRIEARTCWSRLKGTWRRIRPDSHPDSRSDDAQRRLTDECHALRRENRSLRQQVQSLAKFREQAQRDPLTGLFNRRHFEARARELQDRTGPHGGRVFSMVLIDLDDFKRVNDTQGHAMGDQVLRRVARFLLDQFRLQDVCCRLAGDEFVVLLPDTQAADCRRLTARIQRRLGLQDQDNHSRLPVGLSMGIATLGTDGVTWQEVLARADQRMYRDKRMRKQRPRSIRRLAIAGAPLA